MCLPWANTQVRPYKPMPYNPEADYTVVITDSGIACERREHPHRPREAIAWDEVNEILAERLYKPRVRDTTIPTAATTANNTTPTTASTMINVDDDPLALAGATVGAGWFTRVDCAPNDVMVRSPGLRLTVMRLPVVGL